MHGVCTVSTYDANESDGPRPPAPWGNPLTPLLPRWYIETLASTPLPPALARAGAPDDASGAQLRTVGDLPSFWERRSTPIDKDLRQLLVGLVGDSRPPGGYVVLPAGIDLAHLLACPLRARTKNCLQRGFVRQVLHGDRRAATVAELLAFPNFGIMSLLDLMCITEAGFDNSYLSISDTLAAQSPPEPTTDDPSEPDEDPVEAPGRSLSNGERTTDAWTSAHRLLGKLLRASQEFRGARTLGDAVASDLVGLAAALGIADHLDGIPISDLVIGPTLAEEAALGIVAWQQCESLSPVERLILERRILTREPVTLEVIARTTDLSRERIRQLDKPLRRTFEATVGRLIEVIATCVGEQLVPILAEDDLEARISSTFPSTISPDATEEAIGMARHLLRTQLDYSCSDRVCLSREATAVVGELQGAARSLTDDAGLVNEADLRAHLPNDDWQQHWDALVDRSGLHCLSGQLALRDTAKARAKAALLAIGHPATKEEVATLSSLPPDRAGAQLSLLPSVVRADKVRWGLADWIEDEYEGIPAEIIQRIEEDGGATRLERLLDELPRMFGVSENSVRSYVGRPRFELSDGYVSIADKSSIALRPLDDVVHGRLANGTPYWSFKVESRYFDGYSLVGLPPEIANALGCEPDGRTRAWLSFPPDCGQLSVTWRLASMTGATLGYLAEPLRCLQAQAGDRVRLVLEGVGHASLQREDPSNGLRKEDGGDSPPHDASPAASPSAARAQELLERMKHRRRGL